MNTKYFSTGCLALAFIFSLSACEKKNDNSSADDTSFGSDYARIEQNFDDAWDIADEAASTGALAMYKTTGATPLSGCATVTRDTVSVPHVVTIDFGTTNCLCNDGRYRRGQIILTYTGHYKDSGHVHTLSFSNYFVNDNQVTGTKTVTNMGANSDGQLHFDVTVNGAVILANGGTRSCVATRTRTFIAGANTPVRSDDVYEVTGTSTITRPNNMSFTSTITSPLVKAMNCQWIRSGTVQMTGANNNTRVLDYGSGACDNQATMTVNGNTFNISLP